MLGIERKAVRVVVCFIACRLSLDFALQPQLPGAGVAPHPLRVVLKALAGAQLAGIAGMALPVPVLAAVRLIYARATRPT